MAIQMNTSITMHNIFIFLSAIPDRIKYPPNTANIIKLKKPGNICFPLFFDQI